MSLELPSLCQEWLHDLLRRGRQRTTVAAYRASITHFRAWYRVAYHDALDPTQVMARDIRDWQAYQQ